MDNPLDSISDSSPADHSGITPLTYSDPTGEQAVRNLLNGGGPFTITAQSGFHAMVNRESLDYMLLGMRGRTARPKKNQNGKMRPGLLWLHPTPPTKNETPAVNNANHSHREGSQQETTSL